MKKYSLLIIVFFVLYGVLGCSEEDDNNATLTPVNMANPASLVGSYKIDFYMIQNNDKIISNNCGDDIIGNIIDNNNTFVCEQAGIVEARASIQQFSASEPMAVVTQMQLFSDNMTKGDNVDYWKNYAYNHIIFPCPAQYIEQFSGNAVDTVSRPSQNADAVSKATYRGLIDYFVEPPYGNRENNTNIKINYINTESINKTETGTEDADNGTDSIDNNADEKMLVIVLQSKDNSMLYRFELKKIIDDSGNYVYLDYPEFPQGGIFAHSIVKKLLIKETFDNTTENYEVLNSLFSQFNKELE